MKVTYDLTRAEVLEAIKAWVEEGSGADLDRPHHLYSLRWTDGAVSLVEEPEPDTEEPEVTDDGR